METKLERRSFLKASSAIALGLGARKLGLSATDAPQARNGTGKLPNRVLYNQDDSALFFNTAEPIQPEHVNRMADQVADGGAHLLLACCNNQRVNYKSDVWEYMWDKNRKYGTVYGRKSENWIKFAKQAILPGSARTPQTSGTIPGITFSTAPWQRCSLFRPWCSEMDATTWYSEMKVRR